MSSVPMKKSSQKTKELIYQTKNGAIEFRGDANKETIWATLDQIGGSIRA